MYENMEKKYAFVQATPLRHYTAGAFIVRCFDDRFRPVFEKFIKTRGLKRADLESIAGGAKIFASPERKSDREFMIRELEKSIRLHHAKRVILFTHYDCGAYGGLARFSGDEEKQFAFHAAEHKKAKGTVKARFPNVKVEGYFMDRGGIVKTD